jgi:hypothetical protein
MASVALLVASGLSLGLCPQDDTYISFRYARNLVEGHGLTWNPGEPPVEGYTNFSWTLFSAAALALGLDPMTATRWGGLLAGVLLLLLAALYAKRIAGHSGPSVALAPLLMVASSAFVAESVQGLETVPFALLVLGALYAHARELDPERPARFPWSGVLCGLAALTRPEGIGIWGLLLLHRLALALLRRRRLGAQDLAYAGLFLLFVLPHFAFRLSYYGQPLPNTFYAKVGASEAQVFRGLSYLGSFVASAPLLFLMAPAGGVESGRRRWWWSLVLVVCGYIGEVVLVGGDFKPTFRFFIPILAPLALLAAHGLVVVARRLGGRDLRAGAWLLVSLAVLVSGLWLYHRTEINRLAARNQRATLDASRLAGWYLARNHPEATIALGTAGMIPYFSGLPTVDMWGLNDRHIARVQAEGIEVGQGESGHERGDGRYVLFERRPDLIFFKQSTRSLRRLERAEAYTFGIWLGSESQIASFPEFERSYRFRSVPLGGFYLNYFEKVHP